MSKDFSNEKELYSAASLFHAQLNLNFLLFPFSSEKYSLRKSARNIASLTNVVQGIICNVPPQTRRQLCPLPSCPCRCWAWVITVLEFFCPWCLLCLTPGFLVSGTTLLLAPHRDRAWSSLIPISLQKDCRKLQASPSHPEEQMQPWTRLLWAAGNVDMVGGLLAGNSHGIEPLHALDPSPVTLWATENSPGSQSYTLFPF